MGEAVIALALAWARAPPPNHLSALAGRHARVGRVRTHIWEDEDHEQSGRRLLRVAATLPGVRRSFSEAIELIQDGRGPPRHRRLPPCSTPIAGACAPPRKSERRDLPNALRRRHHHQGAEAIRTGTDRTCCFARVKSFSFAALSDPTRAPGWSARMTCPCPTSPRHLLGNNRFIEIRLHTDAMMPGWTLTGGTSVSRRGLHPRAGRRPRRN